MSQMDAVNAHSCLPEGGIAAPVQSDRATNPSAAPATQIPRGGALTGDRPFCIDTHKLDQPTPETAALRQAQLQAVGSKTSSTLRDGWTTSSTLEQSWNTQPA